MFGAPTFDVRRPTAHTPMGHVAFAPVYLTPLGSDQGSQFTSEAFTGVLKTNGIKISMDAAAENLQGKPSVGRALDNVMIKRLWRTVKYDDIYIRGYETMTELHHGLDAFFTKYNAHKHQTLGMSPEQKYREELNLQEAA